MENRSRIRNIKNYKKLFRFMFYCVLILFVFTITSTISILSKDDGEISLIQGDDEWEYRYESQVLSRFESSSFDNIGYHTLQRLPVETINVKGLIVSVNFVKYILVQMIILVFLRGLIQWIKGVEDHVSPFDMTYINRMRKLAIILLLYGFLSNALLQILISLFATGVFWVSIHIDMTYIFCGALCFILADVFEHGVFLQEEYNATV